MIDIDKAIASAVKTGKVTLGASSAVQNAKSGRAKMIILATNCPQKMREGIEYYCRLSDVPLIEFRSSGLELAAVCGKPFNVSALSIREPGDSDILKLVEKAEPDDFIGGSE